jgi:hypothetical protein
MRGTSSESGEVDVVSSNTAEARTPSVRPHVARALPGRSTPPTNILKSVKNARRDSISATLLTALIVCLGFAALWEVVSTGFGRPGERNIFFRQYALHEGPYIGLLGAFTIATLLMLMWRRRTVHETEARDYSSAPQGISLALVALAVGVVGVLVARLVFHLQLVSMDEFSLDFQARLFVRGKVWTDVPWPWRSVSVALTPIFVLFDQQSGHWMSQYLPVYSAIKTPFVALGVPWLLNPLLTALTVVLLASVARELWPNEGKRPWLALALLVSSSELLTTSGTGYSMPAHLLFNLLWLRLYHKGDVRSWAGALAVGALALGLHNPFPHALFVTPFLIRVARERRWYRVGSAAVVYGAASGAWFAWTRFTNPLVKGAEGGLGTLFAWPNTFAAWVHGMNVTELFSWHAPILPFLLFLALARPLKLNVLLTDLALGVLLTFGFFLFFASTQGHGWGYRYAYPVLGNLCLLGAAGLPVLEKAVGERTARGWVTAGLLIAFLVQIPTRMVQTERWARPFTASHAYLHSRDARVVLLSNAHVWYGRDFIRNDPFLESPIIIRLDQLAPGSPEAIEHAYPGQVVRVKDEELLGLGMERRNPHRVFLTPP